MADNGKIIPVILSGGAGTRLWPLSRESYPKQLLALTSERSLLQETVARVGNPARFADPIVVCNADHRFVVAEQLRALEVAARAIVLEPVGRNTAPAAAVAALLVAADDPEALILLLPSDHVVADTPAFQTAVVTAMPPAADGALVTFGIAPSGPETGYGYIRRGAALAGHEGCFAIAEFVEKPDLAAAERFVTAGDTYWNSGMFLFAAGRFLEELARFAPDIAGRCREAVAGAQRDLDFIRLAAVPFEAAPSRSIDYAVMEHTERAAVVPAEMGWSDIGSWAALWQVAAKDEAGNATKGDVVVLDCADSYVRSEGRLVAALGVSDLIVVATEDSVLVLPMDRAQDVREVVALLKARNRAEPATHPRVYRPWGYYQTVHEGERFQVKRITVQVGAALSLQLHRHRAEHWIVVNGAARVTRGQEVFVLNENESTYIPPNTEHRLENPGRVPLNLIEVQSGSYLGEDDIVRLDDQYGRG